MTVGTELDPLADGNTCWLSGEDNLLPLSLCSLKRQLLYLILTLWGGM